MRPWTSTRQKMTLLAGELPCSVCDRSLPLPMSGCSPRSGRDRVSPVTLELCRLRMATLLVSAAALSERSPAAVDAGLTEERIGRLPLWPSDPSFSTEERVCIGFVEQFVIDHDQISDDDVRELTELLTAEGVVTFTTALIAWDNQHRLDNALHVADARG